jgi:hypothetical protein
VKDIGDVFQEERPGRAVKRVHLGPALDVHGYRNRDQCVSDDKGEQELCNGGIGNIWKYVRLLEEKENSAEGHAQDDQRMQADQSSFKEVPDGHGVPSVVIRMGHDVAGEHKEKIHGEVAMVYKEFMVVSFAEQFKGVHDNDHDGRDAAQGIQDEQVFFGVNERGLRGWLHSYNQVWLLGVVLCRKVRKLRLLCMCVF